MELKVRMLALDRGEVHRNRERYNYLRAVTVAIHYEHRDAYGEAESYWALAERIIAHL